MGVAAQILTLLAFAAGGGDPPLPRTEITPILHTGDPAPGIPDATMVWMSIPHIDAEGKVLIYGYFQFDGQATAHTAIWYGGPGTLQLIAYDDMQAPDLPPGMVFDFVLGARLSETGWIGYRANLKGPGIVPGVNDIANFAGPPWDIRKILQGGDPAPGLEPGTVIDVSEGFGLTAWLSDNATLLVIAWLSGPDVDESNDKAIWIGPRDDLQLVWRKGMEAPGTGGARFAFFELLKFNDANQIAFRAGLVNEGDVDHTNDGGQWTGSPGGLELLAREGDQAWGLPDGVLYDGAGSSPGFNTQGDVAFWMLLRGEGISPNTTALWLRSAVGTQLIGQVGDPVPEIGPDVEIDFIATALINATQQIFYLVRYRGDGIDDSNALAMYLGSYDNPQQTLRDGDPAPQFNDGTVLSRVGSIPGLTAMNDVGDIVAGTEIVGPGVMEDTKVVVWFHDRIRAQWFPLLRSGILIDGRTVSIPESSDLLSAYWNKTGGSDGEGQGFNDAGQLGMRVEFTDGTHGNFVMKFAWPGDGDGDADVDFTDFGYLQLCFTGSDVPLDAGCEAFDFDEDEDVDLLDYEVFLQVTTGPR